MRAEKIAASEGGGGVWVSEGSKNAASGVVMVVGGVWVCEGSKIAASGNRTPASCVTGRDTNHYTNATSWRIPRLAESGADG